MSQILTRVMNYASAFLLTCLATLLARFFMPELPHTRSVFFFVVIVIVTARLGLMVGLFATVLSLFCLDYFLTPPYFSISYDWEDLAQFVVFALVAWMTARLSRAERSLRQAARRKDEFLGVLAHELRDPLAMIANGLAIIRLDSGNPETVRRQQELIERQTSHITTLVNDLLDLARIGQGKMRLQKAPLDLRQVIDEAIEQCQVQLEERSQSLIYERPPESIRVLGDPTRLRQVCCNLLTNAIKYTNDQGRIEISLAAAPGAGTGIALLSISDNGIGIPPELLPRIFTLYEQADQALGRSQGGLGIGLSLVYRLLHIHGGSIEAYSEGIGKGSRFTVRLPLLAAEAICIPGAKAL